MTSLMTTEKNWHRILHTQELSLSLFLWSLVWEDVTFPIFAISWFCLLCAKAILICVHLCGIWTLLKAHYVLLAESGLVSLLLWIQHELSACDPLLHSLKPGKQLPLNDCRCFQPTQTGETSAKPSPRIYNSASRSNRGKYHTIADFNCYCCFSVISK